MILIGIKNIDSACQEPQAKVKSLDTLVDRNGRKQAQYPIGLISLGSKLSASVQVLIAALWLAIAKLALLMSRSVFLRNMFAEHSGTEKHSCAPAKRNEIRWDTLPVP